MKTLLISMTCGEGHNYIAKAIKNGLDQKGTESKIIQLYGYSDKEIKRQNDLFLSACKFIPHIYEKIWLNQRKRNPQKESLVINKVIKDCKDYVLKEIHEYNPDVIITTHNNAGAVVSYLKQNKLISDKIVTYGTAFDYCLCPYWETNTNLDYIVTPHERTHKDFIERGFKEKQLLDFGLPVDKKYTITLDKKEIRKELGLDENLFTIILYSGGNCISKASTIIKELIKHNLPIQIVAICGKNKKEHEKVNKIIKKNNLTNILNLGFCDFIDKLYSAGDLVFTRGGGMGLTEQINKNIPFVLREKLIINERINKKLFTDWGLSMRLDKLSDAPKVLKYLLNNKEKIESMKNKSKEFCKPNSTQNFVEFIIKNNKKHD